MRFKYLALILAGAVMLTGARPMVRGYPVGRVVCVDSELGLASVDLGARDGVFSGFPFSVVDENGRQVASVVAAEVYDDMFWTARLPEGAASRIGSGMQVRWVFTPEVSALLAARKADTAGAYREYVDGYPDSRFIPELLRSLPDETIKELNPDYYEAWKSYTISGFEEVLRKHPGTGFARAAQQEIESIKAYVVERERLKKEREKLAAEYEAELARQRAIEEKARARVADDFFVMEETLGKLVNNSDAAVRFEFEPPSTLPPTAVKPYSYMDVRHKPGSFKFKVFPAETVNESLLLPGETPQPLKEGVADTNFDYWEATYP